MAGEPPLGGVDGTSRKLLEGLIGETTKLRYGVTPEQKQEMMSRRELPGAPSYSEDPAAAERYASSYLGAKKWGRIPAEFFNALAFTDVGDPKAAERKKIGALGAGKATGEY